MWFVADELLNSWTVGICGSVSVFHLQLWGCFELKMFLCCSAQSRFFHSLFCFFLEVPSSLCLFLLGWKVDSSLQYKYAGRAFSGFICSGWWRAFFFSKNGVLVWEESLCCINRIWLERSPWGNAFYMLNQKSFEFIHYIISGKSWSYNTINMLNLYLLLAVINALILLKWSIVSQEILSDDTLTHLCCYIFFFSWSTGFLRYLLN